MLFNLGGFDIKEQVLTFNGSTLANDFSIGSLQDMNTLHLDMRMLGGELFYIAVVQTVPAWKLCWMMCIISYMYIKFSEMFLKLLFLPTGKVHGSLARAGKVKGQTPKVSFILSSPPHLPYLVRNIFCCVAG